MPSFLIGQVSIVTDHNGHSAGDILTISFDTDTFTYSVDQNGSVVPTAPGIWENIFLPIYQIRSDTGFTFPQGGLRYFFNRINAFPYYQTQTQEIVGTGVNDLKLSVLRVVNETTPSAGDGSITVTATGTNTPFQFSKDNQNYSTSTTFSNLYAGTYIISVRDSLGYVDYQSVTIDNNSLSEADLGVKYRGSFRDDIVGVGKLHRIDIKKTGYSGDVEPLIFSGNPVTISVRAEGSQPAVDVNIFSHEITVNLHSETHKQYQEFATGGEYEFQVLYYVDDSVAKDGSDYNLRLSAYITPETYTEEYGDAPYLVSFSASDRLADLSSIDYRPGISFLTQTSGAQYRGLASEISIIQKCLDTIAPQKPFRIAVNMYESNMSTTNTSPFHQAYVLQEVYYRRDRAQNCAEVLSNILKPYGAILFFWEGYYYIIKEEQFKLSSIAYNEFGTDLAYDTNGTISPRLAFKASGNTDYFRWMSTQSLSFTRPLYAVNINADGYISDGGVMEAMDSPIRTGFFNTDNLGNAFPSSTIRGVRGYELVEGNKVFQQWQGGWKIIMVDELPSATYIRKSSAIEYTSLDRMNLSLEVNVDFSIGGVYVGFSPGTPAVYLVMKWQFKIGDNYLQVNGEWTTTPIINQFFIERSDVGKFVNFNIDADMPPNVTEATVENYEFKLYPVSAWEYDALYADKAAMIADMKNEADETYWYSGSRRITAHAGTGNFRYYYYYEFVVAENEGVNDGAKLIKATTSNDRFWELKGTWYEELVSGQDTVGLLAGRTTTIFKNLKLETFPNGEEPPEDFNLVSKINNKRNARNIDIDLFHFDLPNTITNEENIYLNYTRLSDGSPTQLWTRLGVGSQSRQEHLRDRLYELYSTPRYKFNGKFYSDSEISILKVLYDPNDDGRLYLLNGIEINPKSGEHSGEILEIFNDNTLTAGQFNDDFDTDNEFL